MKAYCFRSGHVLLGRTVPPGAIELADHPDEAELLRVVRWHASAIDDEEGNPVLVLQELVSDGVSTEAKVTLASVWGRVVRADLRSLVAGIRTADMFAAKPIEAWPESVIKLSGRIA